MYADSKHARDYVDRKSTSGVCTFMGCCITSWFLKKQTALAISTTEAEYVSTRKACQQALLMKQALVNYGVRLDDIPIMCDNKGDIDLSKNPVQQSRTKHIEIRHHFLRDNVQKENISIEKRKNFRVDSIVGQDLRFKELKGVVSYFNGFYKDGHPIWWNNNYGIFKNKKSNKKFLGDNKKVENFIKWKVQVLETGTSKMLDFSPGGVNSITEVYDATDLPPQEYTFVYEHMLPLFNNYYPGEIAIVFAFYRCLLCFEFFPFLGPLGLNKAITFEVICLSLQIEPMVTLFRVSKCYANRVTGFRLPSAVLILQSVLTIITLRHPSTAIDDPRPAACSFSVTDVCRLSAHVIKMRDMPKGMLVLSGLSRVWKICVCDTVLQGADGNGGAHLDVRPTLQRLSFYCTPPATVDAIILIPTLEDLVVGTPSSNILAKAEASQKRKASTSGATLSHVAKRTRSAITQSPGSTTRPSLFMDNPDYESDDESDDDDGDACIEISLITPLCSVDVIPSSGNQGGSSVALAAEGPNTRDDVVAPSVGVSRPRPSSGPALSFRDVSRDVIHMNLFFFYAGSYYATNIEGGVDGNCEFTRGEWNASYWPTFGVLTKEVFKDDQFPTPGEMVWVKSLFDEKLTAKINSRLKGYEEKVASLTGLELQVSTLKNLDNLHAEVDHLSTALNQANVLEAEKNGEILQLKATPSTFASFFRGQFLGLGRLAEASPLVTQTDYAFLNKIFEFATKPLSVILQLKPKKLVRLANIPTSRDARVSLPIAKESTVTPAFESLELSANVVPTPSIVSLVQNKDWVNAMVNGLDAEITDDAAHSKSGERVSSSLTHVVVALSAGVKGDGSLPFLLLMKREADLLKYMLGPGVTTRTPEKLVCRKRYQSWSWIHTLRRANDILSYFQLGNKGLSSERTKLNSTFITVELLVLWRWFLRKCLLRLSRNQECGSALTTLEVVAAPSSSSRKGSELVSGASLSHSCLISLEIFPYQRFDLPVHASVGRGGFCLFSLKDFPFVLVINLLYSPLDVVEDALAQGADGLGLMKNEDHQVLGNKQKLEEDASDCTRVDDDGVEFSSEGGDYFPTMDLVCPSTYQLLCSSFGDSGPDVSFDMSASPEQLSGSADARLATSTLRTITLDGAGRLISYLCMTCNFLMLHRRTVTLDDARRSISYLCMSWCLRTSIWNASLPGYAGGSFPNSFQWHAPIGASEFLFWNLHHELGDEGLCSRGTRLNSIFITTEVKKVGRPEHNQGKGKKRKVQVQEKEVRTQETSSNSEYEVGSGDACEDLNSPYKRPKPTPFTQRITCFKYHNRAKLPRNIKVYEGNKDPEDHLGIFSAAAEQKEWQMPIWCKMFQQTLGGAAQNWFDDLNPKSVDSFEELSQKFLEEFSQQQKC
nr:copia protein [Tanacetum cinerariifolium]